MPTFGSLFAGVGGFDLGLERAGFTSIGQVEIDPFARRVLERRWPDVERWDDVRSVVPSRQQGAASGAQESAHGDGDAEALGGNAGDGRARALGCVDLLVGGFPCQDLSVAGKRAGLGGERSGLFWEIIRIAKAITPTWGLFENVPGLLSSHRGRDMALVIAGLRECWPVVGWRIVDSRYFGVAQRRRRVFFVCGPDEASVAAVLFEPEGGERDSPAGGEAGARVAASLTSGSHGAGVNAPGRRNEDDVNLVIDGQNAAVVEEVGALSTGEAHHNRGFMVVGALRHMGGGGPDDNEAQAGHLVTHALTHEGFDASEDGTGRGTPIVIQDARGMDKAQNGLGVSQEGIAYTVDGQATQAIAFDPTSSLDQAPNCDTFPPMKVGSGLASMPWAPAVAFREDQRTGTCFETDMPSGIASGGGKPGQGYPAIREGMAVRRLTPVECERLQDFPDGWTCLCQSLDDYVRDPEAAAERCTCPDSARYKAMGNAVTVSVIEWIGHRLMAHMEAP